MIINEISKINKRHTKKCLFLSTSHGKVYVRTLEGHSKIELNADSFFFLQANLNSNGARLTY